MVKVKRPQSKETYLSSNSFQVLPNKKISQKITDAGFVSFEGYEQKKEQKLRQITLDILKVHKQNIRNLDLDDTLFTIPQDKVTLMESFAKEGTKSTKKDLEEILQYIEDTPFMQGKFTLAWQNYILNALNTRVIETEVASVIMSSQRSL